MTKKYKIVFNVYNTQCICELFVAKLPTNTYTIIVYNVQFII